MREPTLETVERVRPVVARHARRTPILPSAWLSARCGAEVFLKCEGLQVTGSFKIRGALAALELIDPSERGRGVLTASAGNHGAGLARAARLAGAPCTVVVPRDCPSVKARRMEAEGARVLVSPHAGFDATQAWARGQDVAREGRFVSAYDDPAVIAGNGGTLMYEILDDLPGVDLVVAPCGGGGLISGLGLVARAQAPGCRIVGVNAEASPAMWLSRRDGRPYLELAPRPTWAEGIEGGVGEIPFAMAGRFVDDIAVASETGIRRGILDVLREERLLVEGSAAAGVAALLEGSIAPGRTTCVILTGSNIDLERVVSLAAEALPPA